MRTLLIVGLLLTASQASAQCCGSQPTMPMVRPMIQVQSNQRQPLLRVVETGDLFGRTFGYQIQTRRPFVTIFPGTRGGAGVGGQRRVDVLGHPFGYSVQTRRPFVRIFLGR